jgi:hypothetical protein
MIITEFVLIKMNGKHIKKYRDKGYICEVGEIVKVNVIDIPRNSKVKILVECDVCKIRKEVLNGTYYNSFDNGGYYSCSKCKIDKTKNTNLEKYGVEFYTKTDEYIEKSIKTNIKKYGTEWRLQNREEYLKQAESNLNKYGCENTFQVEEIKDKIKKENLEKYGFEYNSQRDDIKDKIKKTNLIRYGYESHLKSDSIKNKIKETNLKKYGFENIFQNEEVKNKIKKTNTIKYGTEYANQNEEVKNKIKETNLKKYGFENPSQSDEVKYKIKKSRVDNNSWISDEERSDFENYENIVENKTKKVKKELFENWNGQDYYDGEFIRDNLTLHHFSKNFPTIDHKISIYNGYINGIPPEEIAKIENLCITKRSLNSKKNRLTEEEFYKKYKDKDV